MRGGLSNLPNDSVLPNLEMIRRFPSVSQAASNILASCDSQNKQESTQGKPHCMILSQLPLKSDGPTRASMGQMVKNTCSMTTYLCHNGWQTS